MSSINGYELISDWKKTDFFFEAKAKEGDKKYYIRKYTQDQKDASGTDIWESRYLFDKFCDSRRRILVILREHKEEMAVPSRYFMHNGDYYEVTEKKYGLGDIDDIYNMDEERMHAFFLSTSRKIDALHGKRVVINLCKKSIVPREVFDGETRSFLLGLEYASFESDFDYRRVVDRLGKYVSPEIVSRALDTSSGILSERVTSKSDVFVLGLILHDYFTGGDMPEIIWAKTKPDEEHFSGTCGGALYYGACLSISSKIKQKYLSHLIANMLDPNASQRLSARDVIDILKSKRIVTIRSDRIFISERSGYSSSDSEKSETAKPVKKIEKEPAKESAEAFCEPWENDDIEFCIDVLKSRKYYKVERFINGGVEMYKLFIEGKSMPKIITAVNMKNIGLAKPKAETLPEEKVAEADASTEDLPEEKADAEDRIADSDKDKKKVDIPDVWEEHSGYVFDMTEIFEARYVKVIPECKYDIKGYTLITNEERARFFSFEIMLFMGYMKLK
ncbi:MAG: hypothetical protein IJD79_06765 [Clostridia bacterium]|nr:hypothetical protein [Clostridia bacterium]